MRPQWLVAGPERDRRFSTRARAESYAAKHGGEVCEGVGDRYGWRRARLDPTTGAEVVL